jgi:hypothetical protein
MAFEEIYDFRGYVTESGVKLLLVGEIAEQRILIELGNGNRSERLFNFRGNFTFEMKTPSL